MSEQADDTPRPTTWAGRYRLVRPLKTSNGVETLLAVDETTGLRVVLKSIDPAYVPPAARLRFEHETRVLRALTGPGLVGLHDAGTCAGHLFLVQRHLPGRTLGQVLADGPLALLDALRVTAEVASALDIAHSAGVAHRDVKPANVMVGRERPLGDVTLIDFGFARSPWLHESIGTTSSAPSATWRRNRPAPHRRRPTVARTSTPSGSCCTSAWRAFRPSPARASGSCSAST